MSLDVDLEVPQCHETTEYWSGSPFYGSSPKCCCGDGCVLCRHCRKWIKPDAMSETCSSPYSVYSSSITHNLNRMADEAGIYKACWRPEEIGVTKASQLIPLLEAGLQKLESDPAHFEAFNASNGWGLYKHFVPWVRDYLSACREYPEATVQVSR